MPSINGTGCCLLDYICQTDISEPELSALTSQETGDGGIVPEGLVLMEELSAFSGKTEEEIRSLIIRKASSVTSNLGGVGIVPLIHVRQMLAEESDKIGFCQFYGMDKTGETLVKYLEYYNIDTTCFRKKEGYSPETLVLSKGEKRSFISRLGVAAKIKAEDIDKSFYKADVLVYGATALSPLLHADLDSLLKKSRDNGAINFVLTVHDFFSEKWSPGRPWNMGKSTKTYSLIDILIGNREEAMGLTGEKNFDKSVERLKDWGVKNMIFTSGAEPVYYYVNPPLFKNKEEGYFPVPQLSSIITELNLENTDGDSTGCGDNFAGGIIYSIYKETKESGNKNGFDIHNALLHGAASGILSCTYKGGVYKENMVGEKKSLIEKIIRLIKEKQKTP
ncbi:carbohydrate kinase family protein [Spirochaetia bacterium 38H-sp]|uniref:Carbohydrate kinase family protein n=1 Tax=Rarispira pelagica TaxID=3141764 RepID=A0ABU9U8S1_9SPIR